MTICGLLYVVNFVSGGRIRSELYIDAGNADKNVAIHNVLQADRALIGSRVRRPPHMGGAAGKASLQSWRLCPPGDVTNVGAHDEYISWFIDTITQLRRATEARATAALNATLGRDRASTGQPDEHRPWVSSRRGPTRDTQRLPVLEAARRGGWETRSEQFDGGDTLRVVFIRD